MGTMLPWLSETAILASSMSICTKDGFLAYFGRMRLTTISFSKPDAPKILAR